MPSNKYSHSTYQDIPSEEVRLPQYIHTPTTMATFSSANIVHHHICTIFPNNDRRYNPKELE